MSDQNFRIVARRVPLDGSALELTVDGDTTTVNFLPTADEVFAIVAERVFTEEEKAAIAEQQAAQQALMAQLMNARENGGSAVIPGFMVSDFEEDDDDDDE